MFVVDFRVTVLFVFMLNTFNVGLLCLKSCVDLHSFQNEPFLTNSLQLIGISTYLGLTRPILYTNGR